MNKLHATCLSLGLLAAPAALAGDVTITALGTVRDVIAAPATGPYVGVQVGDPVVFVLTVSDTSLPVVPPNVGSHVAQASASSLAVGGGLDTIATGGAYTLMLWNSNQGEDQLRFVDRPLSQGGTVSLNLIDDTDQVFFTHVIRHCHGTYPRSDWNPYGFYLVAGGGFVTFDLATVTIGPAGPGDVVCNPAVTNSTGWAAQIHATGSDLLSANDLGLEAAGLPRQSIALFLGSRGQANVPNAGGSQGTLCLGGATGRYVTQIQSTGNTGVVAITLDNTALASPIGPVAAQVGETWTFQAWYRDTNPTSTTNFTDAVAVTFR